MGSKKQSMQKAGQQAPGGWHYKSLRKTLYGSLDSVRKPRLPLVITRPTPAAQRPARHPPRPYTNRAYIRALLKSGP
ncbi:hypothetical protein TYRP_021835 [Tyrophagus putrescentiae]|nr:hypothetical protein TYRP_021835 [Tyrophagus putrescentiae]